MASVLRTAFRCSTTLVEAALLGTLVAQPVLAFDAVAGALPLIGAGSAGFTGQSGHDLYLAVTLNGAPRGLVHFSDRDGALWASSGTLDELGFLLPADTPDPVRLASLPGVQVLYDMRQQSAVLTVPVELLDLPETVLNSQGIVAHEASTSPGLLFNYDIYGSRYDDATASVGAMTELRAFGAWGVASSTALLQQTRAAGEPWRHSAIRLDTQWSQSWAHELRTLRVGDTLTNALSWTRATRIGGVQFGSDFSLQPYAITTSLPVLRGSAAVPSRLDLYVNGMRQYNAQAPMGPFQLNVMPNISGAGNAQVVLTDELGRVTTMSFPLYVSAQLLRKGLTNWSVEAGRVRENYGIVSNEYGRDIAGSATWRRGMSDGFTFEAHAEATRGLANGGAGGVWLLGQSGVLSGSLAHSGGSGASGSQASLGYNWNNTRVSLALNGSRTFGDYRDVATLHGGELAQATASATASYNTRSLGSVSLSYLHQDYEGRAASRYASAAWYKSIGRTATLSVTANQDLTYPRQRNVFVNFTWAPDMRSTVGAGAQHSDAGSVLTVSAARSMPSEGGWGWNGQLYQGDEYEGGQGTINYLGRHGLFMAGAARINGASRIHGGLAGALVFMDGGAFAARPVDDAVAVVATDGVPGVPVMLENRPVGVTNRNGQLLVTQINAWQNNQLAIDPMGLPADVRVGDVRANATPGSRAGTVVKFSIAPVRAAVVTLVDAAGQALPPGSQVSVNGQPGAVIVGFDGMVYLDALDDENALLVQTPAGACKAGFKYGKVAGGVIPEIGPLRCVRESVR